MKAKIKTGEACFLRDDSDLLGEGNKTEAVRQGRQTAANHKYKKRGMKDNFRAPFFQRFINVFWMAPGEPVFSLP